MTEKKACTNIAIWNDGLWYCWLRLLLLNRYLNAIHSPGPRQDVSHVAPPHIQFTKEYATFSIPVVNAPKWTRGWIMEGC
mmetsp:Transcript_23237/g.53943  ORF Transcript_23237/g.53943 Transcript_23237/m.53943 type:complete len:80 (-) Transcript_23237:268-507(-)